MLIYSKSYTNNLKHTTFSVGNHQESGAQSQATSQQDQDTQQDQETQILQVVNEDEAEKATYGKNMLSA